MHTCNCVCVCIRICKFMCMIVEYIIGMYYYTHRYIYIVYVEYFEAPRHSNKKFIIEVCVCVCVCIYVCMYVCMITLSLR